MFLQVEAASGASQRVSELQGAALEGEEMNTNDILHQALHAMADAQDEIVPGSADPIRQFADKNYGVIDETPTFITCEKCGAMHRADSACRGLSAFQRLPQPERGPDHLNPAKGGNRASDDYWSEP